MKRLPGYDNKTCRLEHAVFLALGLAAVTLVGVAVLDGMKMANGLDSVTTALYTAPTTPQEVTVSGMSSTFTNVSVVRLLANPPL